MIDNPDLKLIFQNVLSEKIDKKIQVTALTSLGGGCINRALKAETSAGIFFIKWNPDAGMSLFETEAKGLHILKKVGAIDIPEVICYGATENFIYLIQEFIAPALRKPDYWENFGCSLSKIHKCTSENYGLEFDNYIGSLPQKNKWHENWINFFIEERLQPQLDLALKFGKVENNLLKQFESLYQKLPHILHVEKPSLLHGDLWSGNVMINDKGYVSLIDPAVYYGNREVEIAFTKLFGGFDEVFYESYMNYFAMEKGYEDRFDIYNLYPLMVHVNLFGGGYLNSVISILRRFA